MEVIDKHRGISFLPIFVFFLIMLSQQSLLYPQTNSKIIGSIINAETREPIPFANIFISNSSIGTASDKNGYFELRNLPNGRYEIIASVLGYEILKATIRIYNSSRRNFRFEMYKQPIEMEEVIVKGKISRKRRRQLTKFRRNLLGSSQNGYKSYIKNEEAIRFEENNDMLIAYAYEPIVIINNGLGYRIQYVLEEYIQTPEEIKYTGYPHFIEQTAKTYHDSVDWQENRKNTYLGSLRHFLSTICENYDLTNGDTTERPVKTKWDTATNRTYAVYADENHVDEEGFFVVHMKSLQGLRTTATITLVNTNWYLSKSGNENEMFFEFDNTLRVTYDEEYYPFERIRLKSKKDSWISMTCDSTILDKQGRYFDRYAIKKMGLWFYERVADMLPFDYQIQEDKNE